MITMREQSFMQINWLTTFIIIMLVLSYIIIHRYANHIKRYKRETTDLVGQLQKSGKRNEELITARQKTAYIITHELRAPLTVIKGYAELLLENGTEETNRYADNILQASKRMVAMLTSLLNFFRLDSGKECVTISIAGRSGNLICRVYITGRSERFVIISQM